MPELLPARSIDSPLGPLLLVAGRAGLRMLVFVRGRPIADLRAELSATLGAPVVEDGHPLLSRGARELRGYFAGRRQAFTLPLDLVGTPFQRRVWEALQRIPYGSTLTYHELAETIGKPRAVRAVGNACARNPLPLIIPCHRVVAQDGSLAGYAGGLNAKRRLLSLERSDAADLPLFRLVKDDPAGPEPDTRDMLPESLHRWLSGHPRARRMSPDAWLAEAIDVVPPQLWPTLADQLAHSAVEAREALVEELLEAWVAELHGGWPDARAMGRFVEVAAAAGSTTFELMGRRIATAESVPEAIVAVLKPQYERIMAGELPSPALFKELAVDFWLALDPERHGTLLE